MVSPSAMKKDSTSASTATRPSKRQKVHINWEPNCLLLDYAKNNEMDRLKQLFDDYAKLQPPHPHSPLSVNYRAVYTGLTPLHMACAYGHLAVAKYLIEQQGADVNARDREGWTILHSLLSEIPLPSTHQSNADVSSHSNPSNLLNSLSLSSYNSNNKRQASSGSLAASNDRANRERFMQLLRYLLGLKSFDLTARTFDGETVLDCVKESDEGELDQEVYQLVLKALTSRGISIDELRAAASEAQNGTDEEDDDEDEGEEEEEEHDDDRMDTSDQEEEDESDVD